jgi:predicted ArsR family transcriptional regulator
MRLEPQITAVALLDDPIRRSLYLYVVRQPEPVSRDQAAKATGATRDNAAFHLDKLVDGGLLEAIYRRLGGRTGPGAGRPSKLYQRGTREVQVTLPARRYELAAELLAQGLAERGSTRVPGGVTAAARRAGETLGATTRKGRARGLPAVTALLEDQGYEPVQSPRGIVRMRNCPFHEVAERHPELVCGMNLAFMEGVLDGADASGVSATLDPQPGRCCVTLRAGGAKARP